MTTLETGSPTLIRDRAEALADDVWRRLNARVFDGALPARGPITIGAPEGAWGACVCRLDADGDPEVVSVGLSAHLFDARLTEAEQRAAVEIVTVHEMIHVWQWLVDGAQRAAAGRMPVVNHGASFRAWRPRLAAESLPLKTGYSWWDLFGSRAPELWRASRRDAAAGAISPQTGAQGLFRAAA